MGDELFHGAGVWPDEELNRLWLADLHEDDCPDPFQPIDQCAHCSQQRVAGRYPSIDPQFARTVVYTEARAFEERSTQYRDYWTDQQPYPSQTYRQTPISQILRQSDLPGWPVESQRQHDIFVNANQAGYGSSNLPNGTVQSDQYAQAWAQVNFNPNTPGYDLSITPSAHGLAASGAGLASSATLPPAYATQYGAVASQNNFGSLSPTHAYSSGNRSFIPALSTSTTHLDLEVADNPRNVDTWNNQPRTATDRINQPRPAAPHVVQVNTQLPTPSTTSSGTTNRRVGQQLYDMKYPHPCQTCGRRFASPEDAQKHIGRYHREIADRPHGCNYCHWRFNFPREVQRHVVAVHGNPDKIPRAVCAYGDCKFAIVGFARSDNRDRHERQVHGFDRRPKHQQE